MNQLPITFDDPHTVEIIIGVNGRRLWINVDNVSILRCYKVQRFIVRDCRIKPTILDRIKKFLKGATLNAD